MKRIFQKGASALLALALLAWRYKKFRQWLR